MGNCLRFLRSQNTTVSNPQNVPVSRNISKSRSVSVSRSVNYSPKTLESVNPKDIPKIPYPNQRILAKICKVYDGDTVTAIFGFGNDFMQLNIRVFGIDAPERRGGTEIEKKAGNEVGVYVRNLLLNKIVTVCFYKWDKYGGRIVGDVFLPNSETSLSDHLLKMGYAKKYDGTKKETFTDAECIEIIKKVQMYNSATHFIENRL